ncbi:hypothetical protein E8E14_002676 [Neopestalotiopsis sp. 37M]|nr:hypothetical protein E8E14_002676 [Neopestalotiopsis sp. 37M]
MRSIAFLAALMGLASAGPTPTRDDDALLDARTIAKRATITDACTIGFCTQNGGTTGGTGGTTTTVSTLAQFTAVANASGPYVIVLDGALSGAAKVQVGSDKSIIGLPGSSLTILGQSNVIVRNMKISKVLADYGDCITIQASSNVWVDSSDFSNDLDHDKDYYDGLIDTVHASEWVTITNNYFHDHWKGCLVGHSSNNEAEDLGHLHVTYAYNWWDNINSRTPMYRFGTGHLYNSYYSNLGDTAINTRDLAEVLVESSVFENCPKKAIFTDDNTYEGYAVVNDVDLGGSENLAPEGNLTSVPYDYDLLGSANVKAYVTANAGQLLTF